MAPDDKLVKEAHFRAPQDGSPRGAKPAVRALAEAGRAYAIYVSSGRGVELVLDLPAGDYKVQWVSTKTGEVEKAEDFTHAGGNRRLMSPAYGEDIALRVKKAS
jgi:hypothetical protein